jgi:hypothetical protein
VASPQTLKHLARHGHDGRHQHNNNNNNNNNINYPTVPSMEPPPTRSLDDIAMAVLLLNGEAEAATPLSGNEIRHRLVLPPSSLNASCASRHRDHPCRLEQAFVDAWKRYGDERGRSVTAAAADVHVNWFVFTTGDVWWHDRGLATELARSEQLLLPASPRHGDDVLLVGGGGLLAHSHFMILSRGALRLLASDDFRNVCRAKLLECDATRRGSGCGFKAQASRNHGRGGEVYSKDELGLGCLREPLSRGRCGSVGGGGGSERESKGAKEADAQPSRRKSSGCEWVFGKLTGAPIGSPLEGATPARMRFVSNAARRGPQSAVAALLNRPHLQYYSHLGVGGGGGVGGLGGGGGRRGGGVSPGDATPCQMARALRGLAAFANADADAVAWLEGARRRAAECEDAV